MTPVPTDNAPLPAFARLIDLASERLGGAVLLASDDFFAPKENLIRASEPVWKQDAYTDNGKWMDGWESRRKRTPGHDWAILRLGVPGIVRGVVVDTAFFTGNYPDRCAIDAAYAPGNHAPHEVNETAEWVEILGESDLRGDAKNPFEISSGIVATHLRLRILPDGGVARLRVHGEPLPDVSRLEACGEVNLAAMELGARALGCSDEHYGLPSNLLQPGRAPNMGDGWETKRRRGPGHDWAALRLAIPGKVTRVVLDTEHNKGNYPDTADIEASAFATPTDTEWFPLVTRQKLQAHTPHEYIGELAEHEEVGALRLNIYPDGGVSRLRVFGTPTAAAITDLQLRWLNALPATQCAEVLGSCCSPQAWVDAMLGARPFASVGAVVAAADTAADRLSDADWLVAFESHPRIGGSRAHAASAQSATWSDGEQAQVADAEEATRANLARQNDAYFDKFGFIFIVCATGKSAAEMLDLLNARLPNDRATEIQAAGAEQRKITEIRLRKYLRA